MTIHASQCIAVHCLNVRCTMGRREGEEGVEEYIHRITDVCVIV